MSAETGKTAYIRAAEFYTKYKSSIDTSLLSQFVETAKDICSEALKILE